jgi:hypothetical protein
MLAKFHKAANVVLNAWRMFYFKRLAKPWEIGPKVLMNDAQATQAPLTVYLANRVDQISLWIIVSFIIF